MNWLDWAFFAIFVVCVVAGLTKGLARVAIGLAATVLGILSAARFYREAGWFLRDYVSSPGVANGIGFVLILIAFSIAGAILGRILAAVFKWVGVGWLDRLGGAAFGAIQALLIAIAIVMIGMAFPRHTLPEAIIHSRFSPYIAEAALVLSSITPPELKDAVARNYDEVKRAWSDLLRDRKKLPEAVL